MDQTWFRPAAIAVIFATGFVAFSASPVGAGERSFAKRLWTKFRPTSANTEADLGEGSQDTTGTTHVSAYPEAEVDSIIRPVAVEGDQDDLELRQIGSTAYEEFAPKSLTLDRLEQIAIDNNPTAREAAAVVDKARGQFVQSGLYPNPVVGYQASEVGNEGKAGQQGIFFGQEFVTGGKLRLARDVASNDVERLNWQYEAQLQKVLTDVRLRFYEVLGAQREIEIATQLQDVAQEGVRSVELRRKEAGEGTEADVLQVELDLNQVLITKQSAEQKLAAARRRLSYVVGAPELAESHVSGILEGDFVKRPFTEEWVRLSQSPVLQAADWKISRASALIRREEAQPIPNVDVQAGVQYDSASEDTIASLQIGVPLPIHNRNQGNIRSACAELQQAREARHRLELRLRDQLADALQRYETALFQEQQYRTVLIPKSEKNIKLTTEAWKVGEAGRDDGLLKLVIARRSFYEAKLAHVRALTELRLAEANLDGLLLTGGLDAPGE